MQPILDKLKGDTGRLAVTYLAIIMALTLVFSGIIYGISSSQFDRPLPPRAFGSESMQFDGSTRDSLQDLFQERAQQARAELLLSIIFLNLTVLFAGAIISYFLARKTLEPIEAAMHAQAQFVSDASHELRTPLTTLQVTNEVALRKKKLTLAQAKNLIEHNLTETIKLRALSESLLGLARQDVSQVSRQDIDIQELANDVINSLQVLANEKNVTLILKVPNVTISANAAAINQILRVFIDNAVKYGPESSNVTVSFDSTASEHQFAVHDDGQAIPAKHRAQLFKRFYRIDESRSSSNTQGTGLGLSIAKAAAERQGYSVSLQANDHEGNTFILHIPKV